MPLMHGFPPPVEAQVTLANWQQTPFNRWAFHHVRELVPSADIPNDPRSRYDWPTETLDISGLIIDAGDQGRLSFDEFLIDTSTDGIVIARNGCIVFERYTSGMSETVPHIVFSVSKSFLGLVAGILSLHGQLKPNAPVADFVPEVTGTAYDGASIRDLLDMRAGVAFNEDYLESSGAFATYRKAIGHAPTEVGEASPDLRSFLCTLTERDGPHGGRFHYVSPNTDLLAWVIERATGKRYPDLINECIWRPIGAAHSAYITVDRLGAPYAAGGICATVRDLALLGQLIATGGEHRGTRLVPRSWLEDIVTNGDPCAWAAGEFAALLPGGRYRSKWYADNSDGLLLFGAGIHGQFLFIDAERQLVIAKVSSQVLPLDAARVLLTLRAVSAIRHILSG
jgi:CubicO group peptidase (beta-lactamase class C family)